MKKPIEIKYYKECIPKKGIWYNHLGTVFISVMRKSKPYVRRKSINNDNKKDNELSEWHRVWQYDRVESEYGVEKFGEKSYEKTITIDNENHRIDSVVENIAIEFQHTLSVDLDEMNSRYKAHSKFGFLPYLVIDLTNHSLDSFELLKCSSTYKKWSNCKYAISNNLFLDLKDGMIRIVKSFENISYKIEKDYFLKNLPNLENELFDKIKIAELFLKREEIIEKRKLRIQESKELIRLLKEKNKEEWIRKKREEKEKERYYHRKRDDEDFKYYRKCLSNPIIEPYLKPYDYEMFDYHSLSEIEDNIIYKSHWYDSNNSRINIEYITVTEIIKEEIPTFRGTEIKSKYSYLYSTIKIKDNKKTIVEFEWRKGQSVKKIDKNEYLLF